MRRFDQFALAFLTLCQKLAFWVGLLRGIFHSTKDRKQQNMKIINWCVPFSISFLNELESFWFVLQLFMTTWWQRKIGNTKQIFTNSTHTHEQQYTVSRTNKAHSYSSSVMSRMNNHQKKVYSKQDPKMVCLATKACKQEIAKMESLTKNGVVTKFLAMSHQKFTLKNELNH